MHASHIPFFISTQASVSNIEAAKFYKKLGAKRIVPARELNLAQIKKISKIIELEAFVHGAMCVSISGRCFTSQFLFCKSANRGKCLHPCRRSYTIKDDQEGYELKVQNNKILSAKDLCMLPYIEEMKKAGIGTSVNFIPVHYHPYFKNTFGFKKGDYPNTEYVFDRIVSMPLFPQMEQEQLDYVIENTTRIVEKNRK